MAPAKNDQLLAIIHTQNEIASRDLELGSVMQLILERSQQLTRASGGVIEIAEGEDMVFKVTCGEATPFLGLRVKIDSGLSGLSMRRNETLRCDDTQDDPRVDAEACRTVNAGSMLCIPLVHRGSPVGAIRIYATAKDHFADADVETLTLLSGMLTAHLYHASAVKIEAHDSRHDSLTGLLNRRAYEERLAIETARANRYDYPLSLCLLDLDGFRAVNDLLGHPAGDDILRKVAGAIDEQRLADDAFRVGGDVFAVLMPQTTAHQAEAGARRLAEAIDCMKTSGAGVGASYGVAQGGHDPSALHDDAERELLAAKERLQRRDRGIQ
jgi:diguanylate cyclase (GGDEF)-like protein